MDLLQNAYHDANQQNLMEINRWEAYKEEHEQAKRNLEQFGRSLQVEIMASIGSKAVMPAKLYRTNEILISHSPRMYSEVSAYKAMEICSHRIDVANKLIDALAREHSMYKNKLELPFVEDAFCSDGEREIIEEYDEIAELKWQEEHKLNVRKLKEKERMEREFVKASGDVEDMKVFADLELMEELDKELEQLNVENDDVLENILSGKIAVPDGKIRIAHGTEPIQEFLITPNNSIFTDTSNLIGIINPEEKNNAAKTPVDTSLKSEFKRTHEFEPQHTCMHVLDADTDTSSNEDDDLPAEWCQYRTELEHMNKHEQLIFCKDRLNTVYQFLDGFRPKSFEEFIQKTDKIFLADHLLNEIDRLRDEINEEQTNGELKSQNIINVCSKASHNRSVKFSNENDVVKFCAFEKPCMVTATDPKDVYNITNVVLPINPSNDAVTDVYRESKNETEGIVNHNHENISAELVQKKEKLKEWISKVANADLNNKISPTELIPISCRTKSDSSNDNVGLPSTEPSKSILKNKEAVRQEIQGQLFESDCKDVETSTRRVRDELSLSTSNVVLDEVREREHIDNVSLLPATSGRRGEKKSTSRFKSSRQKVLIQK